ncbi:MAG: heavy metal-binding domain-containing protein [Candidatus Eisenbacteria bacterium]
MRRTRAKGRTVAWFAGLSVVIMLVALGTLACQPGEEAGTHMEGDAQMEGDAHMEGDTPDGSDEVTIYTCPMHPEVISNESGKCPECGMYLVEAGSEEASMDAMEDVVTWTCPMHPEVQRHEPGECPECGMDLIEAGAASTK